MRDAGKRRTVRGVAPPFQGKRRVQIQSFSRGIWRKTSDKGLLERILHAINIIFKFEMLSAICGKNRAADEWCASWTRDGKPVTLRGCMILRFAPNRECEELREYWHSNNYDE